MYIFYVLRNQLLKYTEALSDVQSYVKVAMASDNHVESAPTASPNIIYRQHFEKLKSTCTCLINSI